MMEEDSSRTNEDSLLILRIGFFCHEKSDVSVAQKYASERASSAQRSIASLMAAFRDGDSAAGARQGHSPLNSQDQESAAAASLQTKTAIFCPSFSFGVK